MQCVKNDFPIPCDGIIGMDFLSELNCKIDFNNNCDFLCIRPSNFNPVTIPLSNTCYNTSLVLPARSQVIRKINICKNEDELLVVNQEIKEGVLIANSIISKEKSYVRILNSTNNDVIIDFKEIKTEKLSNYEIIEIDKNKISNRNEIVMNKLKTNFPKQFKDPLSKLCNSYCDIFALENEQISANNFYKQKLRLNDKSPTYIKNYRIPHSQKDEIEEQVKKLVDDGIVEPSMSNYNSPLLLVPKKSLPNSEKKRWRLVIDYRQVNKKLIADKFPLPRIDDILDQMGRAKYFSCLDLMSGFHQIEMEEKSRDITSFSTSTGSYRFTRFIHSFHGLKIAPNSFQRMMTLAFSGLKPSQAFLYMDDLVVLGCSEKHMLSNLTDVFDLCRKYNLKLHPDKCSFFMHEVTYLGHKCTNQGILPDDSKYSAIRDYPVPKDGDEAKRFVAFCNYYRRFIRNFADFARHITHLTKKNVKFEWTNECQEAFEYLKKALMSPTILQYPNFEKEFCITTDASKKACGAVLCQEYDGKYLPISYASKAFTSGESNKSTIEQELTAIHWAINYFKPYIYGKHFLIKTDHRPLTYLFSMKNPTSKLTRMRLDLEEFDYTVEYLRGKNNYVADALSRITINELKQINVENGKIFKMTTRSSQKKENFNDSQQIKEKKTKEPQIYEVIDESTVHKLMSLQVTSDHCLLRHGKIIIDKVSIKDMIIKKKIDLDQFFSRLEIMTNNRKVYEIKMAPNEKIFEFISINKFKETGNNILKNLRVALLPLVTKLTNKQEISETLKKFHDDPIQGGHFGITKTFNKVRRHYYWVNMKKDIAKYVKTCEKCQKAKILKHTKTELKITDTPINAFDTIVVDTIGPLPKSVNGNEYAVTLICDLTKYLIAIPVQNKSAKTVAKAIFESFVLHYGPMKILLSDMGTEYKNALLNDLCNYMKTKNVTSTAYHHQTLGTIEKSHRTFNEYVRSYISTDKSDWDEWLKYFVYCFNTTPSIAHGYCPYELIFGKTPNTFKQPKTSIVDPIYNIDDYSKEIKFRLEIARNRAKNIIEKYKEKQKIFYDKTTLDIEFKIGDKVLLRNEAGHKLDNKYLGPFSVVRIEDDGNVLILGKKNKKQVVHRNRLKIYNE